LPKPLLLIPFGIFAVYVVLGIRGVRYVLGPGDAWRSRLRAISALGPGGLLRHTYRALIPIVVGLVLLPIAVNSYSTYLAYQGSPTCGEAQSFDCRDLRLLQVSSVEVQSSRSGDETVVQFSSGYGSATFYADDVPPASLESGGTVTAEVWRGDVTAVVIDGRKHESFASQSDAWIGIVAGAAILLIGLLWLVIDLAIESMDPDIEQRHDKFASPRKRRRTLYVLLPLFGSLLGVFGLAYIALVFGAVPLANTLADVYLIGGTVALPALVLVFVGWFVRAYLNVGAMGLRIRHSDWFVAAALLLPPLSLYMPYRLALEVVTKTRAPVTLAMLNSWWACAIGWLVLTLVGLTIGNSDPTSTTPQSLLSDVMLAVSVAAGLVAVVLTLRLVQAIDITELAMADRRPPRV
jgi:hypothetical protein